MAVSSAAKTRVGATGPGANYVSPFVAKAAPAVWTKTTDDASAWSASQQVGGPWTVVTPDSSTWT